MIKNAFIFGAGAMTGAIGLPAAVIYFPPARKAFAKVGASILSFSLRNDATLRTTAIRSAKRFIELLETYPKVTED